jgi:hypothetical protein
MITIMLRYDNLRDLADQISQPVRWMTDPEYRKAISEERRIKDLIAKDGLKVIFDAQDPKSPPKALDLKCH